MKKFILFFLAVYMLGISTNRASAAVIVSNCMIIDKPGSYILLTNIKAAPTSLKNPGPACILIFADFVTLDLQGHTITGPGTGFGIYSTLGIAHYPVATRISNGSITGFDRAIALEGDAHTAENVRVAGNNVGLTVDGLGIKVRAVQASRNTTAGILCFGGFGHSVQDSVVISTAGDGINFNSCSGSKIIGNTSMANGGYGIAATCPSLILQNMVAQNGAGDIVTSSVPACTLSENNPAP